MELRDEIARMIVQELEPYDATEGSAEELADRILSLEPIAQALKLTVVKTMENR